MHKNESWAFNTKKCPITTIHCFEKVNVYGNMKELLETNCEVGKLMKFLKDCLKIHRSNNEKMRMKVNDQ